MTSRTRGERGVESVYALGFQISSIGFEVQSFEVLGFWGFEVLRFWGFGVLGLMEVYGGLGRFGFWGSIMVLGFWGVEFRA
jgi:hypothetical protein